jgi:hypothetical protein
MSQANPADCGIAMIESPGVLEYWYVGMLSLAE